MSDMSQCTLCGRPLDPADAARSYSGAQRPYHAVCGRVANEQLSAQRRAEVSGPDHPGRRGAWTLSDVQVLDRDSPEGQAELARRAEPTRGGPSAEEQFMAEQLRKGLADG